MNKTGRIFLISGFAALIPFICICGCIILACILLKKRKQKVGPHISVATKSAVPDNYPPPPPPPPRPPQPPHMTNGGIYRAHDVNVAPSYSGYPADCQTYPSLPPYPTNPPSYGPNPSVYYDTNH
uniref:Uncharacterized protein n=1 Tax=Panagrolaimus davidi TaxID=227884 RepID=A0A914QVS2_9BILA